jgi:hypothetical protein
MNEKSDVNRGRNLVVDREIAPVTDWGQSIEHSRCRPHSGALGLTLARSALPQKGRWANEGL